ncbi:shikimate dehydrogenase family protein [Burkholderia sp. Ac-20379]|uniref:shikimate dehydrogenase family protein n=1 Tax=Burkholderia sp. Ac-20379 TaxID=2703900 RepID=UPI00197DDCDA|nr:shikimate dehydrogenase [Burkholderia sp. Ac-20379]MBN3724137.1 shikimate dehydrogenase [Burkholderia sp. Ac-20379]
MSHTPSRPYQPATRPTFYFIGVTTGQSSIMRVFPEWARHLGLGDVEMKGIDFPLHASPAAYREAVQFLRDDPLSVGALVTTHKLDLYAACQDLFDEIDPYARLMGETSCLSKRDGKFICHAKDPITSGLAIDGFLPDAHFARTGAEVFSIGAGGSTIALTWHLMQTSRGANRPSRVIVSDRSAERLEDIARIHRELDLGVPCEYLIAARAEDNDAVLARLSPGALVINATGLGKDAPGSPLSDAARFPERAVAWDLNYRGELVFLDQARAQAAARQLQIEGGWTYFIYGWTRVIAEVFHIDIPTRGPGFDAICRIAAASGKPSPAA